MGFIVETSLLKRMDRIPDQAFQPLDLGLALGNRRVVPSPLAGARLGEVSDLSGARSLWLLEFLRTLTHRVGLRSAPKQGNLCPFCDQKNN